MMIGHPEIDRLVAFLAASGVVFTAAPLVIRREQGDALMSKIRGLLDSLVLPALGLGLATLALVPDLIGIGAPGFGVWEIALLVTSIGLFFVNLVLPVRPLTALQTLLTNSNVGWREVLLISLSVVVTGLTGDILLRFLFPPTYVVKTKYGWTVPANTVQFWTIQDTSGQFREVTNRYFQHGFRRWGNTNTHKRKLLVIGDSYTQASQVSNGEEWYSYLENRLSNIELFVYGGGGYGSLQEYMVLDDYIDSINPDLILWQFCSNDYRNNLYEWELSRYPHSSLAFRPFLEEDKIVYRLALPFAKLRQYSFIADRLLKEYDLLMQRLIYHGKGQAVAAYRRWRAEHDVASQNLFMEKGYSVTLEIMKKVKNRAKEIPIYLFNACSNVSEYEYKMCLETGIICISGIAEYVNEKQEGHEVTIPNDGHWNKLGNQLVGERLVRIFKELDIVK